MSGWGLDLGGGGGSVAVGSITGLGTGVATALAVNTGTAGAFALLAANTFPATQTIAPGAGVSHLSLTGSTSGSAILTTPAAAAGIIQQGAADVDTNASIVAQTYRTQGALAGGTSDQAGKNFTLIVSPGKGTGAGGTLIVQTAPAGSTGTTVGTPVTTLTVAPSNAFVTGPTIQVGSGSTTTQGWILGYFSSGISAVWSTGVTPGSTNYIFASDTGNNITHINAPTRVDFRVAGTQVAQVLSTGIVGVNTSIGFSTGAGNPADVMFTRGGLAGSMQLGATNVDTNASVVAQILRTQGVATGGTNNQAGKDFTIIVSPGKGTGIGGSLIIQTAPAGASGNTLGTPTTALTIDSTQMVTLAGKLKLGNAATTGLAAGVLAATTNATIVITDSTGQDYRIPCII